MRDFVISLYGAKYGKIRGQVLGLSGTVMACDELIYKTWIFLFLSPLVMTNIIADK